MKADKYVRDIARRLDRYYPPAGNYRTINPSDGSPHEVIVRDDEYYLSVGRSPPRFAYYRHVRIQNHPDRFKRESLEAGSETITQDELDYELKSSLRASPEERYQHRKREWYAHKLSYFQQTVDEKSGKAVDIIKDYGCGHENTKREEGGCCVPECRFYRKKGRFEDWEVIEEHNIRVEYFRKKNKIVDPPDLDTEEARDYIRAFLS